MSIGLHKEPNLYVQPELFNASVVEIDRNVVTCSRSVLA